MYDPNPTPREALPHWLGHPRGLYICFFTEMWERFSYYGMRALLIFFLTEHFLFDDTGAYLLYGAYTSLVYITPVIGGILADRYLGQRKAVTFGAILLVLGHFGMAFESSPATVIQGEVVRNPFFEQIFYFSLALIITGVGFLKPNISTIVGALYTENDPRRDSGFTIFYMGINIGAFIASILCGWLGQTYGWSYGFGLAGLGMLAGLLVFIRGADQLQGVAEASNPARLSAPSGWGLSLEWMIYLGGALMTLVAWQLIQYQQLIGGLLGIFSFCVLLLVLFFAFYRCTPIERDRMLVAALLIVFSVFFWALFEQAGSSLNLFTDRSVDRTFWGVTIPASTFQALNPMFIFLLAPFFSLLWPWLHRQGREPSTPAKFSLAMLMIALGFFSLVWGGSTSEGVMMSAMWIVVIFFFHTCGELCISPVGLSMITKLSVKRIASMMMGVWFLANSAANYLAGWLARLTSVEVGGTAAEAAAHTLEVYMKIGYLALALAILVLLCTPWMKRTMHGVR